MKDRDRWDRAGEPGRLRVPTLEYESRRRPPGPPRDLVAMTRYWIGYLGGAGKISRALGLACGIAFIGFCITPHGFWLVPGALVFMGMTERNVM